MPRGEQHNQDPAARARMAAQKQRLAEVEDHFSEQVYDIPDLLDALKLVKWERSKLLPSVDARQSWLFRWATRKYEREIGFHRHDNEIKREKKTLGWLCDRWLTLPRVVRWYYSHHHLFTRMQHRQYRRCFEAQNSLYYDPENNERGFNEPVQLSRIRSLDLDAVESAQYHFELLVRMKPARAWRKAPRSPVIEALRPHKRRRRGTAYDRFSKKPKLETKTVGFREKMRAFLEKIRNASQRLFRLEQTKHLRIEVSQEDEPGYQQSTREVLAEVDRQINNLTTEYKSRRYWRRSEQLSRVTQLAIFRTIQKNLQDQVEVAEVEYEKHKRWKDEQKKFAEETSLPHQQLREECRVSDEAEFSLWRENLIKHIAPQLEAGYEVSLPSTYAEVLALQEAHQVELDTLNKKLEVFAPCAEKLIQVCNRLAAIFHGDPKKRQERMRESVSIIKQLYSILHPDKRSVFLAESVIDDSHWDACFRDLKRLLEEYEPLRKGVQIEQLNDWFGKDFISVVSFSKVSHYFRYLEDKGKVLDAETALLRVSQYIQQYRLAAIRHHLLTHYPAEVEPSSADEVEQLASFLKTYDLKAYASKLLIRLDMSCASFVKLQKLVIEDMKNYSQVGELSSWWRSRVEEETSRERIREWESQGSSGTKPTTLPIKPEYEELQPYVTLSRDFDRLQEGREPIHYSVGQIRQSFFGQPTEGIWGLKAHEEFAATALVIPKAETVEQGTSAAETSQPTEVPDVSSTLPTPSFSMNSDYDGVD